jgi:hypothetical protein
MAFASRRAVLVLCLNLGRNIHLSLSKKKQAGLEIVGLSCQLFRFLLAPEIVATFVTEPALFFDCLSDILRSLAKTLRDMPALLLPESYRMKPNDFRLFYQRHVRLFTGQNIRTSFGQGQKQVIDRVLLWNTILAIKCSFRRPARVSPSCGQGRKEFSVSVRRMRTPAAII